MFGTPFCTPGRGGSRREEVSRDIQRRFKGLFGTFLIKPHKTAETDLPNESSPFNTREGQKEGFWTFKPVSKGVKTVKRSRKDVKTKEGPSRKDRF